MPTHPGPIRRAQARIVPTSNQMFLMNTQPGNYGDIHSGNPVALLPGRQLKMCRTFWFWSSLSLITLFYPVLRQLEVSSNLLWILEMKEKNGPLKDSLTSDSPKVTKLRKGRARTQACSGSRLTALSKPLTETGTLRFSKLSFSYGFKET